MIIENGYHQKASDHLQRKKLSQVNMPVYMVEGTYQGIWHNDVFIIRTMMPSHSGTGADSKLHLGQV